MSVLARDDRGVRWNGAGGSNAVNGTTNGNGTTINTTETERTYSRQYVILVLLFTAGSSLGAIFINKATLTAYKFHYPLTLMLLQSVSTVVILSGITAFQPSEKKWITLAEVRSRDYPKVLMPTILFIANVSVGLSALALVNIPMFSAFRRLTVLFVMTAEFFMLKKRHSKRVVASVIILTSGAFVSAYGDVKYTFLGYALVFLNNALTAMYLASIKNLMKTLSLDPLSLLYHTAFLAMPIVLFLCIVSGEISGAFHDILTRPDLHSIFFYLALSFVAASAFCVNYSTSLCTHVTAPLTTSVTGQVKNVLQTFLGFFSWDYVPTFLNVMGLLVALLGQLAFAYFKHEESKEKGKEMKGRSSGGDVEMNGKMEGETSVELRTVERMGTEGMENGMKERSEEKRGISGNGLPRPAVSAR